MKKLLSALVIWATLGGAALAGTFTEVHSIYCGAIVELGRVGYPTWNPPKVIKEPSHGKVFILGSQFFPDSLVYKSDYGFLGVDTFIVECAHATQITCDTGIYIMQVIGCPPIFAFTEAHEITCNSLLLIPKLGFPTWATPEIVQAPTHGTAVILSENPADFDTLKYSPSPGFIGMDTIIVDCAHATQITCETGIYIIQVSCLNLNKNTWHDEDLNLSPNPVSGFLNIESTVPLEFVTISSAPGKTVLEIRAARPFLKTSCDLHNLPTGIYFLTAWADGKSKTEKFVLIR